MTVDYAALKLRVEAAYANAAFIAAAQVEPFFRTALLEICSDITGGGGGSGGGTIGGALDTSVQAVRAALETGVTHADLLLIAAKLDALIAFSVPDKVRTASTTTAGVTSATPNTATQALAARALRNYLLFVNTSDTSIGVNFSGAATGAVSIPVPAGGSFVAEGNYVPPGALSVICTAASKSYVIVEA